VKAEIIASGTELLLGEVIDTNSSFIASQLAALGLDLYYVSIVGDNYERFSAVLSGALQRSDIVIITGGLGPTKGDITREVIAGTIGEEMTIDPALRQQITAYFNRLHLEMPINNLKQATTIPSAKALPNPLGSAPGWWVEKSGKTIISLPGPPGEMQPMWQAEVYPRLGKKAQAVIISRTLKTWGLTEALIDQMVDPYMSKSNPTLALYAKPDGIQLRITAKAVDRSVAAALIDQRETELRNILKEHVWGVDQDTLESIVSDLLIKKGISISCAESFTGGILTSALSAAPSAAKFFKGGVTVFDDKQRDAYHIKAANNEKADAGSAICLARVALEHFQSDIAIGIDGYLHAVENTLTGRAYIAILCTSSGDNVTESYPTGSYQLVRRAVMQAFYTLRQVLLRMPEIRG
jgi:nicotinamide-nucleotide amidase